MDEKNEEKKEEGKKSEDAVQDVVEFAKNNTFDTAAYVLLILGVIIYVFNTLVGGLIVGCITGFYYTGPIISSIKGANQYVDNRGLFRSLILGGFFLCLAISAPFLFLGTVLTASLMALVSKS